MKKIVDEARLYFDNEIIEKLELSIISQFPEISFDEDDIVQDFLRLST